MNKKNITATATGVLAVTIVITAWLLSDAGAAPHVTHPPRVSDPPRPVRVGRVTTSNHGPTVRLSAVTKPSDHSRVSFALGGRLLKRPVDVGDRVKKGDLLARIEPDPMQHAVNAGKAAIAELDVRIEQAERNSNRMNELAKAGAVTTITYENTATSLGALRAAKDAAMARHEEAKRQLKETVIRAPFEGTVSQVFAEPDEVVAPGAPILLLDGAQGVEIELEIPEPLLPSLVLGATVPVTFPLAGIEPIAGTIETVSRTAQGPGRLFPVVVTLPAHEQIRPGLTAYVALATSGKTGLAVDVSAVINPTGNRAWVLRVVDGIVEKVPVTTGSLVEGKVHVSGALKEKDWIVTAGHQQLMDKDPVEVL